MSMVQLPEIFLLNVILVSFADFMTCIRNNLHSAHYSGKIIVDDPFWNIHVPLEWCLDELRFQTTLTTLRMPGKTDMTGPGCCYHTDVYLEFKSVFNFRYFV